MSRNKKHGQLNVEECKTEFCASNYLAGLTSVMGRRLAKDMRSSPRCMQALTNMKEFSSSKNFDRDFETFLSFRFY